MTIKQQNKHGAIQKVCHLHSSHLAVSHLMNFTLSHPLCYSLKIINYEVREKTIFLYRCPLQRITLYQRR